MINSNNLVMLTGNTGATPELKTLDSGQMVANFPLAVTKSYKPKNSTEYVKTTHWFQIVAWGKNAENICKNVSKGDDISIEGELTTRSYKSAEGKDLYVTEIYLQAYQNNSSKFKRLFAAQQAKNNQVPTQA